MLYITFDNVEVGRMQARAVMGLQPSGNYVIIKGNKADANADFLRGGYQDVIGSAVDSGQIKIVGETYTDNWDPSKAQTEMEQYLTQNENKVDAVLAQNDGMAGGVVSALAAQGLAGRVPVSGQDGDAPALNRVALGLQTVDVWKDARLLGAAAGQSAVQLCGGVTRDQVTNVGAFNTGRQQRERDPAAAAADQRLRPERRARRWVDQQGGAVPGRPSGHGGDLLLMTNLAKLMQFVLRVGGACGPPPPVAAPLASSLRAPSRGDPPHDGPIRQLGPFALPLPGAVSDVGRTDMDSERGTGRAQLNEH